MADSNMVKNTVQPKENHHNNDENEWEIEEIIANCNDYEFEALKTQLDELNSALDKIEHKNDVIHAELNKLLQSNRETRKQFQEYQKSLKPEV
ncbi:bublin coiled-coil protein-like [Colletes latitarsis]|uniref:bublin coiled-coil protein-like n=1 Tax=Colletes latitarsis TaxID=2605962 RepID=UPI0040365832